MQCCNIKRYPDTQRWSRNHLRCHTTKYFINSLLCQDVTFFFSRSFSHCTEPYVTACIKFQAHMEIAILSENEKLAASVDSFVSL